MGILTTPGQADALCTVITLGYIINSAKDESKKNTYIIFEEGNEAKDNAARKQHNLLRAKLTKLANKDLFEFKTQRAADKPKQPIILAHTDYSVLQSEIAQDEIAISNRMEKKAEQDMGGAQIPLSGAYVGGLSTTSKMELLDPSILYWYDPEYRNPPAGEVQQIIAIEEAKAKYITETIQDFLGKVFKDGHTLRSTRGLVSRDSEYSMSTGMSDKPTGAQLFASVHGMTQSIIHYGVANSKENVNIELALGKDTCKVASCIPCSMFMWANKTPASATHFGRGDNWNFPPRELEIIREYASSGESETLHGFPLVANWLACVQDAYKAGKACFTGKAASWTTKDLDFALQFDTKDSGEMLIIPPLFLEALTFESSFVNRMLNTLKNVPA